MEVTPQLMQLLLALLGQYYWLIVLIILVAAMFGAAKFLSAVADIIKAWRTS
jgi:hypothetical protein